jgi:hypothetical protein
MIQNPKDIRLQRHCLIRTAIHIGHLAGVYVPSDIYSLLEIKEEMFCLCAEAMNMVLPFR